MIRNSGRDQNHPQRVKAILGKVEAFLQSGDTPFASDTDMLESAAMLTEALEILHQDNVEVDRDAVSSLLDQFRMLFHERVRKSSGSVMIDRMNGTDLSDQEREILLALAMGAVGVNNRISTIHDLQTRLKAQGGDAIRILHHLSESSRLVSEKLVTTSPRGGPTETGIAISTNLLAQILGDAIDPDERWNVDSYEEFLQKTHSLTKLLYERGQMMQGLGLALGYEDQGTADAVSYRIDREYRLYRNTLRCHPDWPLYEMLEMMKQDNWIIMILLGRELGFLPSTEDVYSGEGLCLALSESSGEASTLVYYLRSDSPLREMNMIQPCGGQSAEHASDTMDSILSTEFELTGEYLKRIRVKRKRKGNQSSRAPKCTFDQLVLSNAVMNALDMIHAQALNHDTMFKTWGLGDVIPYGTGLTILFSGEPGLGKTATAEALAHALDRSILIANYAEIQNCYVGQTEKNISRIFGEARESESILFWDEADAMFFDRDSASRNWEVRDVNVLLQEIETFNGVCILSTNRPGALEKALSRRIAVKVMFQRPDRAMRAKIWKLMLTPRMPLEDGVTPERLSAEDLTGGEIKNVILNAARSALRRGRDTVVTWDDFQHAIRMERFGGFQDSRAESIGFHRNGSKSTPCLRVPEKFLQEK